MGSVTKLLYVKDEHHYYRSRVEVEELVTSMQSVFAPSIFDSCDDDCDVRWFRASYNDTFKRLIEQHDLWDDLYQPIGENADYTDKEYLENHRYGDHEGQLAFDIISFLPPIAEALLNEEALGRKNWEDGFFYFDRDTALWKYYNDLSSIQGLAFGWLIAIKCKI